MNNVQKQKRANKNLPFFFKDEFRVSFIIIFISSILLISTFSFDIVPPILNRGIQPATFPKALLVLIIILTLLIVGNIYSDIPKEEFAECLSKSSLQKNSCFDRKNWTKKRGRPEAAPHIFLQLLEADFQTGYEICTSMFVISNCCSVGCVGCIT